MPASRGRRRSSGPWRRPALRWLRKAVLGTLAAGLGSLALLNVAVAVLGESAVNPLSPRFLEAKWHALGRYGRHRARCAFRGGHDDLPQHVAAAAARRGVNPRLLAALVDVESSSRAHRISAAGAMGPAQLMPGTADLLGVKDPFDPAEGIDGGARYLRQMLDRFHGNTALALAAYTAGPGAIAGGRVPRNPEVLDYVARVTARWRELEPPPARPR